jgi:hypothetical protein
MFAKLRAERPVSFHEEASSSASRRGRLLGGHALRRRRPRGSRLGDVHLGKGSNIGDLPVEMLEFFGSMINMDRPGTRSSGSS